MNKKMSIADAWQFAQQMDEKVFGTSNIKVVQDKLIEECNELINSTDDINEIEEFGDVLFILASYARWNNIDPVVALTSAIIKVRDRHKKKVE